MKYTLLTLSDARQVTLCGTNVYPNPEYHPDRVLDEYDLLYLYSGEWRIAQDDLVYTLRAGDAILLRAGSHHWGTAPCTVNTRTMFVHFNRLPGDFSQELPSMAEASSRIGPSGFCLPPLLHCGQNNQFTRIFNSLVSEHWSHSPNKTRRTTLLLNLLLDLLVEIALNSEAQEEEWSVRVMAMFREHQDTMFSLDEVAAFTGMNVRTLSTRFRQVTGKSVHQYQLDLKLEMAYKALRTERHSVKEVAASFGFCDPYYFSRLFKQRFGVTPKQIKNRDPSANVNRPPVT